MSFCAPMFSSNVPKVMVEFVDEDVWVVQIILAGDIDRLVSMDVAAQRAFFPSGQADSEFRFLYMKVLGEELQCILRSFCTSYEFDNYIFELGII